MSPVFTLQSLEESKEPSNQDLNIEDLENKKIIKYFDESKSESNHIKFPVSLSEIGIPFAGVETEKDPVSFLNITKTDSNNSWIRPASNLNLELEKSKSSEKEKNKNRVNTLVLS